MRSPPTAATESPKKHPETQGSQHQTNKQDSIKQSMREPPWGSRSASPLSTWGFFLHHLGLERESPGEHRLPHSGQTQRAPPRTRFMVRGSLHEASFFPTARGG